MNILDKNVWFIGLLVLVLTGLIPGGSLAADVDVYAEGTYTESDLVLHIYADINGPNILSYGVKVVYSPSELTVISAEKNEDVWYTGDGTTNYPYMDPETSVYGEVIIIGGKLDTSSPTDGVGGQRVLLGKIVFSRTDSNMPFSPSLSIELGKNAGYKNFVTTAGTVLDDVVTFGPAGRPTMAMPWIPLLLLED
ncbi:MAG: hypothetical protein EP297_11230 [Gammaproteobacteria bacterium]|nr:MAG: hypothetical protein EP297_11230 [Gammaproteobacteria bacterium]